MKWEREECVYEVGEGGVCVRSGRGRSVCEEWEREECVCEECV